MISELKLHAELREKKKSISMRTCSQFPSLRHAAVTQLSRLLVWAAEICPQLIPVLYDASPDESWSLEPSRRSRKWALCWSVLCRRMHVREITLHNNAAIWVCSKQPSVLAWYLRGCLPGWGDDSSIRCVFYPASPPASSLLLGNLLLSAPRLSGCW